MGSVDTTRRHGEMDSQWMESATIPAHHRYLLTRHLALLFGAGVPLLRCLEILAAQSDHPTLSEVLWSLQRDLQQGHRLSSACSRFPAIFSGTYVAVLKVAEESGALHRSLLQLAHWLEMESKTKQALVSLVAYPLFILGLTGVMALWMCWAVLPGILEGVRESGSQVPWPTMILMYIVKLFQEPLGSVLIVLALASGLGFGYRTQLRPPVGLRFWFWKTAARVPMAGGALRDWALMRYCAAAELLLEAGTPLISTLQFAPMASGNPWLADDSTRLCRALETAQDLGESMSYQAWLYGGLLPALLLAYGESGRLSLGFRRTRLMLEEEVESQFQMVRQALEPILLLVLASIVLFFLLSVMLPLYAQLQDL